MLSLKKLKETLIAMGYKHLLKKEYKCDTSIMKELYTKGDICVYFLKIGKSREKISVYSNWGEVCYNAGHLEKFDVVADNVIPCIDEIISEREKEGLGTNDIKSVKEHPRGNGVHFIH